MVTKSKGKGGQETNPFQKSLKEFDLEQPEIFLISGTDTSILESSLGTIKKRIADQVGPFEVTVYSGEPGDDLRLLEELFNIPLFSPYRLILVRQAQEIFKPMLSGEGRISRAIEEFKHIPDRTLLVIEYPGPAPRSLLKILGDRVVHLSTQEIRPWEMDRIVRQAAKDAGLHLSEEAVHEIRERVEPKQLSVQGLIHRIRDRLPEDHQGAVSVEDLREFLYPATGLNPFTFIDALFEGDRHTAEQEFLKFNPAVDNLFGLFKNMLNRTNEIRRARIGFDRRLNDQEMMDLLGKKGLHPFVQKKTLERLKRETGVFSEKFLGGLYNLLVELQVEYRSHVPQGHQMLYLQQRLLDLFHLHRLPESAETD